MLSHIPSTRTYRYIHRTYQMHISSERREPRSKCKLRVCKCAIVHTHNCKPCANLCNLRKPAQCLEPWTVHYALRITHYSLRTTPYALCTLHYALRTPHYALLTMHSSLCTHYALHTMHYTRMHTQTCIIRSTIGDTLCATHYARHIIRCTHTMHNMPSHRLDTMHCTPCTHPHHTHTILYAHTDYVCRWGKQGAPRHLAAPRPPAPARLPWRRPCACGVCGVRACGAPLCSRPLG